MQYPGARACLPLFFQVVALCSVLAAQEDGEVTGQGRQRRLGIEEIQESWLMRSFLEAARLGEQLTEAGITPSASLVWDGSAPLFGGTSRRLTGRAFLDLSLEVDLGRAAGLEDFSSFVEFYAQRGRDGSTDVGDVQAFSNIDGPNVTQLAELWVERAEPSGHWRVKVGKHDANSEFAFAITGLQFLHSSAGFSPTIFPLPTYPDPAIGLDAFVQPAEGWRLAAGLFDAAPHGPISGRHGLSPEFEETFWIGEVRRIWAAQEGPPTTRLVLGAWHHSGTFDRAGGGAEEGTGGLFGVLERRAERRAGGRDASHLDGFLQWGLADGAVSPIERHLGAGLILSRPGPRGAATDTWRTGIYASRAELGDTEGGAETAIELMQEIPLTRSVLLKPDLQLVLDPGGEHSADDVWVATLRVELHL